MRSRFWCQPTPSNQVHRDKSEETRNSPMKPLQKYQLLLLIVASALISLCVSCQSNRTSAGSMGSERTVVDRCRIDVATPQDCPLSKGGDERAIWINNSGSGVYVCFNPIGDPFEGYAFYVPPNGKRKSGKITDETNPSTSPISYYISASPCVVPPPETIKTNPKIIIGN